MSHVMDVMEYAGFCKKVLNLKNTSDNAATLMQGLIGLNEAILNVAEYGTDGYKLHELAQRAKNVQQTAVRTPGLKPLRVPECLGVLAKAMHESSLAVRISSQLLPVAQAFPVV